MVKHSLKNKNNLILNLKIMTKLTNLIIFKVNLKRKMKIQITIKKII
jgi:hypothetical protein